MTAGSSAPGCPESDPLSWTALSFPGSVSSEVPQAVVPWTMNTAIAATARNAIRPLNLKLDAFLTEACMAHS